MLANLYMPVSGGRAGRLRHIDRGSCASLLAEAGFNNLSVTPALRQVSSE